jgi:hypothetical protein
MRVAYVATPKRRTGVLDRAGTDGLGRTIAPLLAAASVAVLVGAGIAIRPSLAFGVPALVVAALVFRYPPLAVLIVFAIVSLFGKRGAYFGLEETAVPLLELALAIGAAAAILHLLASETAAAGARARDARSPLPIWLWAPAALWGLSLVVLRNEGDLVSGVRDAMIFIYPLLIALPLALLRSADLRRVLHRAAPVLVLAAWWLTAQGLLNYLGGKGVVTSSGQLRSLFSTAGPVLLASMYLGVWMYQRGEWTVRQAFLAALPVVGLVFINHRSVYLGAVLSLAAFAAMRLGRSGGRLRALSRVWVPALIVVVIGATVTPEGRAGVERFLTITNRSDPNISARIEYARQATHLTGRQWIFGKGVGDTPTSFRQQPDDESETQRKGAHNSYAAAVNLGGLIGFGLLFTPVAFLLARMVRRRDDPLIQVVTALAVYALVVTAFNVVLENVYLGISVWLPLVVGGKLALERSPASERSASTAARPLTAQS